MKVRALKAGRLVNPALIEHERERRTSVANRIGDRITGSAGR